MQRNDKTPPTEALRETIHGVCFAVAVDPDGPLSGILILGEPGTGKSALALCLVESCPWGRTRLVADDIVTLHRSSDKLLIAQAPEAIAGLIEVRGFGPAPIKSVSSVVISAVFNLDEASERVPEKSHHDILGVTLPKWPLALMEGPALGAIALRAGVRAILAGQTA